MPGGRPRKFKTVEELENKMNEYFEYADREKEGFYSILAMCNYIDLTRETLCQYENKEGFSDAIKRAKAKVEERTLELASKGKIKETITIFNLKNNFGWKDKTEVDTNIKADITIDNMTDEERQKRLNELLSKLQKNVNHNMGNDS